MQTGASTVWLLASVVLQPAPASEPLSAPLAAPSRVSASPANAGARITWSAPANGGSQITSYTVTPHAGSHRLRPTVVSGTSAAIAGLRNG